MKQEVWVIHIAGYGDFLFVGTWAEAEVKRVHKSNYEQGVGRKRLATLTEIQTRVIDPCLNHPNYNNKNTYHCKCDNCKAKPPVQKRTIKKAKKII